MQLCFYRPTVHTNSSRKRSFLKRSSSSRRYLFVFLLYCYLGIYNWNNDDSTVDVTKTGNGEGDMGNGKSKIVEIVVNAELNFSAAIITFLETFCAKIKGICQSVPEQLTRRYWKSLLQAIAKFMKWYFWFHEQRTIMQVSAGNLLNSLPAWRFCRKKRAPVITGFCSSATIQPTSSQKRRPFAEWNKDSDYPLEDTTSLKLLFY